MTVAAGVAMLIPMVVAGATCGTCMGWSYGRFAVPPTVAGWFRYNATYLVMFGLLGALSVAVFDPVTTMAAVVAADAPPDALIAQALPLTLVFTVVAGVVIALVHIAALDVVFAGVFAVIRQRRRPQPR